MRGDGERAWSDILTPVARRSAPTLVLDLALWRRMETVRHSVKNDISECTVGS